MKRKNEVGYSEGVTPIDPDEMEGLKFSHVTTRGELDHLEQANIQEGLRWLQKYKGKDILNDEFARLLHTRMFGDVWQWAGQYRLTEKNIGVDPFQISVNLRNCLDDVECWVEFNTFSPLEAAARFHHRLVYIHPFPNGNGRHARFYADALLTNVFKVDVIDWSGGYDLQQMTARRSDYIDALRAADAGNFDQLLGFVGVAN